MSEHQDDKQSDSVATRLESALVISVKEARKIMGVDARTLTDDELTLLIWRLMEISLDLLEISRTSVKNKL